MTCTAKRHFRFSLVFFDHSPALTAQKAFHSSANVEIDSPCFVSFPVYSAMYSASFLSTSCFGFAAGPGGFSFFFPPRFALPPLLPILEETAPHFSSLARSSLFVQPS